MSKNWYYLSNLKPGSSGYKRNQFSRNHFLVFILVFSLLGLIIWRSFAAPNPNLTGDLDGNNIVDVTDLSILLSHFGTAYAGADIDGNGMVDITDLSKLLTNFGKSAGSGGGMTVAGAWYSTTSAWNVPIPSNVAYRVNDANLNSAFRTACGNDCLVPALGGVPAVYFANASTPLVPVTVNYPKCADHTVSVPIPAGAKSPFQLNSNDREARLDVMMTDSSVEWDLYKPSEPGQTPLTESGVQCPATGNWSAIIAKKSTAGWQGSGSETSSRAGGLLDGAGLIRPRDTKLPAGSTWDHALAMTYAGELKGNVPPALSNDGVCTDTNSCVPAGARLRLDPSYNCTGSSTLTLEWQRQMCRTLQKYGAIISDKPCFWPCAGGGMWGEDGNSTRLNLSFVDGGGNYRLPYDSAQTIIPLPSDVYPYIHFIDWEKWTGL